MTGFLLQMLAGTLMTLKVAFSAALIGLLLGSIAALGELQSQRFLRLMTSLCIFIIRSLPEILILFFIYFGLTTILNHLFNMDIDISPFAASVASLSLIFAAYASQVFRSAFLAIEKGQVEAGKALGLTPRHIFLFIELPQLWRYALPGLGNLWLVLLKDTAIIMLIGMADLMGQAKMAASSTQQPFTYYALAAFAYLLITSISQKLLRIMNVRASRCFS